MKLRYESSIKLNSDGSPVIEGLVEEVGLETALNFNYSYEQGEAQVDLVDALCGETFWAAVARA